jgi:RNA polymerase sigma-70 factor (ECF subfamily)
MNGMRDEAGDGEDGVLMDALASGREAALGELMERWGGRVTAFLERMSGRRAVAEELAHETFVRIYQSRGKWRRGGRFQPWIFSIAANLVRQRFRWERRHPVAEDGGEGLVVEDPGADPAEMAEMAERAAAVREAVLGLPEELREAVVLTVYEGLTQVEAAEAVGTTVKGMERRVSRARELLRRRLEGV